MELSLVSLDEKQGSELVLMFNQVLAHLDKSTHDVDIRAEGDEMRVYRWVNFLQTMRFQFPENMENFRNGLTQGERSAIYPLLHWALSRLPQLEKRAYLAKYLMSIECPQEFLQDEALMETYNHFKGLQAEFKEQHKQLTSVKKDPNSADPKALRSEITQLEDERGQLINKINRNKSKMQYEDGFNELLEATSSLRKEQEEESKLMDRGNEQTAAIQHAERLLQDTMHRHQEVRSQQQVGVTAEQLLAQIQNEVKENQAQAETILPREVGGRMDKLRELQTKNSEPQRSEGEVMALSNTAKQLQQRIATLNEEIQRAQGAQGDDKLAMFRQHAQLIAKKVQGKQDELEAASAEKEQLTGQIDEKEAVMSELSGPKFMKREEFKQYAAKLREKTNVYKKKKSHLGSIRAENVVLNRTEQVLKGRCTDVDEFMQKLEAKKGVAGYFDDKKAMEKVSELTSEVNETKGKTLEEISKIVTDINQALKERKNRLAPQIKELRSVRQRYQELEQEYLERKAVYENTAVGLDTERIKMEQECNAFQDDCLREESRYHYLNCLISIAEGQAERIRTEEEFERGNGKLLRDFRTYKDL
jgi:intraflagellar transport protein 81